MALRVSLTHNKANIVPFLCDTWDFRLNFCKSSNLSLFAASLRAACEGEFSFGASINGYQFAENKVKNMKGFAKCKLFYVSQGRRLSAQATFPAAFRRTRVLATNIGRPNVSQAILFVVWRPTTPVIGNDDLPTKHKSDR
jgi:hypothetical protein